MVAIHWKQGRNAIFKMQGETMKTEKKGDMDLVENRVLIINEAIQTLIIAKQLIEQLQNRRIATDISA